MNKERYINAFTCLGSSMETFGRDPATSRVISDAIVENPWFSPHDIITSVKALREGMLSRTILEKWLADYPSGHSAVRDIAVIMAGNIPLAGFFDMMCVLCSGHRCLAKPSSKDSVLIGYAVDQLRKYFPREINMYSAGQRCDGLIASGSDDSLKYFNSISHEVPALIRGSRYSLAVLSGDEGEAEFRGLSDDIFLYNGMGCRSVSLLLLPRGCDVSRLGILAPDDVNPKYGNCYRQQKAMLAMRGEKYFDHGSFLMAEQRSFAYSPGMVNYSFYDYPEEVEQWILANEKTIQCVVSKSGNHLRGTVFGRAQYPAPWDYPDGVDVMSFLSNL